MSGNGSHSLAFYGKWSNYYWQYRWIDPVRMETEMVKLAKVSISKMSDQRYIEEEEGPAQTWRAEWQRHGQNGEN